jgi:large subunit ribosomal protein L10e
MRMAFGKAVGTAARVEAGQKLFTVGIPLTYLNDAKVALTRAGHKLPTPIQIIVDSGQELIK